MIYNLYPTPQMHTFSNLPGFQLENYKVFFFNNSTYYHKNTN